MSAGCTGQAPEPRLSGTGWTLTGYVHNGTPVQALTTTKVTLDFGKEGKISGTAGCNHYFASYEVKGTAITIGQAGSTMMYCGEPGVMDQESAYLTLLGQAKTIVVEGDRLTLADAKGTTILIICKDCSASAGTPCRDKLDAGILPYGRCSLIGYRWRRRSPPSLVQDGRCLVQPGATDISPRIM